MKLWTFVSIALLATNAMAQVPTEQAPAPVDPVVAAQHEGLRELKATMEKALNERDLDKLLANVDENVVFTTMNGDVAKGREAIRAYFDKMMNGPDRAVDGVTTSFVADELSHIYGEDVAVAYGHTNDHYVLKGGKEMDIHARWTATLVRKDSRWLVAAFHYSDNIFDNPVLNTQRTVLLAGGGGGAVLLGILGFLFGRRSSHPA